MFSKFSKIQKVILYFMTVILFALIMYYVFENTKNIIQELLNNKIDIIIILILLTLIFSILMATILYLYNKNLVIRNETYVVPEKWAEILQKLVNTQNVLTQHQLGLKKSIEIHREQIDESNENISQKLKLYENEINLKNESIKKLNSNYDFMIFKRFLLRFVKIKIAIEELENTQDNEILLRLFDDAFDECGVELISPQIGDDYRKSSINSIDRPRIVYTNNESLDFTIKEVNQSGYGVKTENGIEIIIPARVTIYRVVEERQ